MPIDKEMFNKALTSNGYPIPEDKVYEEFKKATLNFSMEESAMFLANLIHESAGFQFVEECRYAEKGWHVEYRDRHSLPGKLYHGRGYIPLTWATNYLAASEALGLDNLLLRKPQIVSNRIDMAMKVSKWYWEERVRPALRKHPNCFCVTTKAINGKHECKPTAKNAVARSRYTTYEKVAVALNISNPAIECDCCNQTTAYSDTGSVQKSDTENVQKSDAENVQKSDTESVQKSDTESVHKSDTESVQKSDMESVQKNDTESVDE